MSQTNVGYRQDEKEIEEPTSLAQETRENAVMIDFCWAFDIAPRDRLLDKLWNQRPHLSMA